MRFKKKMKKISAQPFRKRSGGNLCKYIPYNFSEFDRFFHFTQNRQKFNRTDVLCQLFRRFI